MSDRVIHGLLRRAGMEPPQWHDEELTRAFADDRDRLLSTGLIGPTDPTSYSECPHCGPGSMGRVRPLLNRRSGGVSFWLPCRECGLVEIPGDALRRWRLDLTAFADAVARAAGLRGDPQPFAAGRGWLLGRAAWAARSHEAFLLRAVFAESVPALRDRLDRHPKAVVFAATPEDAAAWRPHGPQTLIGLDGVLSFDGALRCDVAAIEAALLPPQATPSKGRPEKSSAKKAALLAKIQRLKEELIAHIRAAKEYAHEQERTTGRVELLPRPTRAKLGQLAGLEKYEVTRCFNDEAGVELRLLWEAADDLKQILRYRG